MLIKDAADRKIPVSLPSSCPQVYRTILSGKTSISHSMPETWLTDALFSCLRLCCIINKTKLTLSALASQIPEFDTYVDTYVGNKNRAAVMEKLSHLDSKDTSQTSEGIRLSLAGGSVTIIPSRVSGFRIISESKNFEAAKELCTKIEDIIKTEK
jgi:phosphomannomutase